MSVESGQRGERRGRWLDHARRLSLMLIPLGLAACSTAELSSGLLSQTASKIPRPMPVTVALRPTVGVPEYVRELLSQRLNQAAERRNIALLVDADAVAPKVISGFFLLKREKTQLSRLTYVWDVTSDKGERISQVAGEQIVAAVPDKADDWSMVTPAMLDTISEQVMERVSSAAPAAAVR